MKVWVLDIDYDTTGKGNHIGYTSVHKTREGAERRLKKVAREWGLEGVLEADELVYGIGHLPVEDDE